MRILPVALLSTFLGLGLAACGVAPPSTDDWLAVGRRTPAQTFRTFQTGLAGDAPSLEYGTLSRGFKEREGINLQNWVVARRRLLEERPYLRRLAEAEVVSSRELSSDVHELVAELRTPFGLFGTYTIRVELVREEFFEIDLDGAPTNYVGYLSLEDHVRAAEREGEALVQVAVFTDPELLSELADGRRITELRVATQWTIEWIELLDDAPQAQLQP